jgi:hypothetical protein
MTGKKLGQGVPPCPEGDERRWLGFYFLLIFKAISVPVRVPGASIIMPDFTPLRYRALYEIYPGREGIGERNKSALARLKETLASLGRSVGEGPGYRRKEEPKTGCQEERKGHKTIQQGSGRDK